MVRAGTGVFREAQSLDLLTGNADVPFAANFPSIVVNNSGTAANAHTPANLQLAPASINWSLAGPIFPINNTQVVNGVTYTGVSCTVAVPCSSSAVAPNFIPPYTIEWNLDIQQAITNSLTVDVAYVGNHGGGEEYLKDLNQPALGAGWTGAAAQTATTGSVACLASAPLYNNCHISTAAEVGPYSSQFPYLNYVIEGANGAWSNYDALQVTLQARNYHRLSFISGYTYSHALDINSTNAASGLLPGDNNNLRAAYGNSQNDLRHRFTFAPTYAIPDKKSPGQMLEGWSVNGILTLQSGMPWSAFDETNDFLGTGEVNSANKASATGVMQPWNYSGPASAFSVGTAPIPCFGSMAGCTPYPVVGGVPQPPAACVSAAQANGPLAVASLMNFGCYVKGAGVLTPPAYGSIGNSGRNPFPGPGYDNVDFSVSKLWKLKERYSAQFRVEFFNLFNHTDLALGSLSGLQGSGIFDPSKGLTGDFGYAQATPDTANPVVGSGGPRHIQFALKLAF